MLQIKGINDKKSQEEKIYYLIVFAFILFIFVLGLKNLGLQQRIRVIDDEFGYWGIAAHLAGYDWSDLLSRTTYYSFGYSFLLIPLWWLFKCGFGVASIYQIAVVMNVCMHAGSFLIALVVAKKLFPNTNRFYRLMACMISSFYYAYISQTGKAWTEVYLMFMYWCVVLCMIQVLEKRTILWYFLLILATANIFAIHMRALGVVAAVVGVCLLRAILVKDRNWKKAISVCAIAGIILIGVVFMRNYTKDIIYASNPSLAINDFSGQVSNVQHIASSVLAIVDLALSMAGKIYYLGIATFGSVILGVLFICEENISTFWRIVKTKKIEVENRQWVLLMVLVSTAGTVAIDAVYKCWKYISTGSTYTLADTIIYGRYVDFIVGLLVLYCILRVCEKKIWVRQGVIAVIILFICTLITQNLWDILIFYNGEGMSLRNTAVPGISYLLDGSVDGFAYKGFAWACIGAAVFLLFTASQNEKYKNLGMVTIVSIVCISGFILADQHIAEDVWGKAHKEKTVESIVDIVRKSEIEEINYITDSNSVHGDLKILQWCLPEYTINVINPKEIEEFKDNALYLTEGAYVRQVASMDKIMNYVYDSGELAVFCTSDNKDLQKIIDLSHEAATTINPRVMDIELSTAVAEYAYQKVNGSIYRA